MLIIGDYTARVGDPSGRSSTRPVLSGEEIDANAETFQEPGVPRCSTATAPRSGATASGSTCRWRTCSASPAPPRWPSCSSATTSPSATPRASRSRSSSCSIRCCRATTRWPIDADVELGGTDQKFNLLLARDIQQAYGKPPQSILTMPILPGTDGAPEDVEVARQLRGRHRAAGGGVRQADAGARRGHARLLRPAAGRAARRRAPRRGVQAPDGAAAHRAACTARRPRRGRGPLRPPPRERASCPTRSRSWSWRPSNGSAHLPAVLKDALRHLVVGGAAAARAGRRASSTASRCGADELDVPAERLDGAVLQVGKRRFRARCRDPLGTAPPRALYCLGPARRDHLWGLSREAFFVREAMFEAESPPHEGRGGL